MCPLLSSCFQKDIKRVLLKTRAIRQRCKQDAGKQRGKVESNNIKLIKSETLKRGKPCNKRQTVCKAMDFKAMDFNIAHNQTLDNRPGAEITCKPRDCIFRSSAFVFISFIHAIWCSAFFFHVHYVSLIHHHFAKYLDKTWQNKMTQNTRNILVLDDLLDT